MEGKGPYRIYDPGGAREATLERHLDENAALKGTMKGIRSLGELLEESQLEASKLRQRVEDLAKENTVVGSSPSASFGLSVSQAAPPTGHDHSLNSYVFPDDEEQGPQREGKNIQKSPGSGSSSEFEVVPADEKGSSHGSDKLVIEQSVFGQNADSALRLHLQRLETSLSVCAEEADRNQVFTHLGRMALEFNRLATKVHKNEQRTCVLQTLCEQLQKENEDLRWKLEKDLKERHLATENMRVGNMELKRMVTLDDKDSMKDVKTVVNNEMTSSSKDVKLESVQQQNKKLAENVTKDSVGAIEQKVKSLEHQRNELLDVNKQWDKHFRSMKQQYEQKVNALRQKLADSLKLVGDLEAEREQKLHDFERKLLLAKSRIETEEGEKEALKTEVKELVQKNKFLQDQLSPVSRQREYREKEIQRLNKALEEALHVQASAPPLMALSTPKESSMSPRRQDQHTQIQLLKQQVKIYEEDFKRERSDRERMSEEKEALQHQVDRLKTQLTQQNTQLQATTEALQREKEKKLMQLRKQHKPVMGERLPAENQAGTLGPMFPPYQYPYTPPMPHPMCQGFDEWQILFPPAAAPIEQPPAQDLRHAAPPEYPWWMHCRISQNSDPPVGHASRGTSRESETSSSAQPK